MKKILYFILLIVELFIGVLFMIALLNSSLYIPVAFAAVSLAAMLIWHGILFAKASNVIEKRRIMFRIALAMLIPIAVFIITYIVVAIAFVIAFTN